MYDADHLPDYTDEETRKSSFQIWPLWYINPKELARQGFYYRNEKDIVQCIFCQVQIEHWNFNDIPLNRQLDASSECPFLNNKLVLNKPCKKISSNKFIKYDKVNYNFYDIVKSEYNRKKTFPSSFKNVEKFVECGFYHTKEHDYLQCFPCGIIIGNWEKKG
ncbi:hypothetical protein CEXT_43111 [Caerostris extrusa]|uniref:Uncharacterized protein n=1 Tax=Caerostris extrusa TaxID=172846 RepID=A0AAV4XGS4_CAEEX|nr:hypothetical protein CEXT_43111 [Caerostris extrusa]